MLRLPTLLICLFARRISPCDGFLFFSTNTCCQSPTPRPRQHGWTSTVISFGSTDSDVDTDTGILSSEPFKDRSILNNFLVCGDGDLSFSASIADELATSGIALTATVLEDQETHHQVYKDSQDNLNKILSACDMHTVGFGIDATNLSFHFPHILYDHIQFNFPHWRGKANTKRNRELLDAFLKSASTVLTRHGEVHVALCHGQGGATAATNQEWRQSWMAPQYAGQRGLLLRRVTSYEPFYSLSSHRGVDRPFRIGTTPELYTFGFPNKDLSVEPDFQLCCRHELHIVLPSERERIHDDMIHGSFIHDFIKNIVPEGIRVEVPQRQVLSSLKDDKETMVVYLIVYCGEHIPLTRDAADGYRQDVELAVSNIVSLRDDRLGRLVSRPFPYPLLDTLIKDHYLM